MGQRNRCKRSRKLVRPIIQTLQSLETLETRLLYAQVASRWSWTASGGTGTTGSGITLTYSIVPDGTLLGGGNGEANTPSVLRAKLDSLYGSQSSWLPIIQQVFSEWGAISGITYVYEPNDDGIAYSTSNSGRLGTRGDVRLGAHPIDNAMGALAYSWYPSFGDIVIDSADLSSGGYMYTTTNNSLRLRNVLAHEHGHGLGFDHVDPVNGTKLMEAISSTGYDGPQFDDMLAVQRSYGDAFEKNGGNNAASIASDRGTVGDGTDFLTNASLSTLNDLDFYKFTITSAKDSVLRLTPIGPTYQQGPQGGTLTTLNATMQMDLQLQVLAGDGTTVLATANGAGIGVGESLNLTGLGVGTYYLKVMPAPGATDTGTPQVYSLSNTLSASTAPATTTTVSIDSGANLTITDTATGGKNDALTVTVDSVNSRYLISDPNNLLGTVIPGSSGNGTHTVYIPFSSFSGANVYMNTAGGNDTITINGTAKNVIVDAGAGTDSVNVPEAAAAYPVAITASAGNDALSVNSDGVGAAGVTIASSETFGAVTIGAGGAVTMLSTGTSASNLLTVQSINITGTGKLDLRDNDLAVDYTGASVIGSWSGGSYTNVTGLVVSGRIVSALASGTFKRLGVAEASSALGLSGTQTGTFDAQPVDATTVLVKFTYGGDANLDGKINVDDYGRTDLNSPIGTNGWYNGDYNCDGKVNVDDYGIIDFNVGIQASPL